MVLSMERWKAKLAVVTGASSGIGEAIAEALVSEGVNVVGLARRQERLEALAERLKDKEGKFYTMKVDISNEEDLLETMDCIKNNLGPIYILVNNAGVIYNEKFIDGDITKWKAILNTNVLGLCVATKEAIRDMLNNNVSGHIININSMAGHQVDIPAGNLYSPSKFAVTALTEVIRQEMNQIGSKIRVTSISSGLVKTEIFDVSGFGEVKKFLDGEGNSLEPKDVADAVVYALSTPPHVQVHELTIAQINHPLTK